VLQPFTLAQDDPFANVPVPTPSGCSNFPYMHTSDTWNWSGAVGHQSGDVVCFKSEMDVKGDLTLGAATYVLDAANIKMTNTSARLACNGCTIILTSSTAGSNPNSIGIPNINGGELDLVAPTTGPYKGIMIYQDRRAPADNSIKINGNNDSYLEGASTSRGRSSSFRATRA
jgi:hypothetical protein